MHLELTNCTETLLSEIRCSSMHRIDVAKTYALALRSSTETDWERVNKAILDRWSMHALTWIKDRAWSGKCFEGMSELVL